MIKLKKKKGRINQLRQLNIRLIASTLLLVFLTALSFPKSNLLKSFEYKTTFCNTTNYKSIVVSGDYAKIDKSQGSYFTTPDLLESEEEAEFCVNKKIILGACSFHIPFCFKFFLSFAPSIERVRFFSINKKVNYFQDFYVLFSVFRL